MDCRHAWLRVYQFLHGAHQEALQVLVASLLRTITGWFRLFWRFRSDLRLEFRLFFLTLKYILIPNLVKMFELLGFFQGLLLAYAGLELFVGNEVSARVENVHITVLQVSSS